MKRAYLTLLCAMAATMICSCNKSVDDKLHDQCVETYKNERISEAKLEVESLKKQIEICEYILNIKDNDQFIKAVEFMETKTEASQKWITEFEKNAKEMESKIENADNKADDIEIQADTRAESLDL